MCKKKNNNNILSVLSRKWLFVQINLDALYILFELLKMIFIVTDYS